MSDLSKLESGGASTAADPASPLMVAWEQFKQSESFANSRKWASHDEHLDGSMWNCFMVGFNTGTEIERQRAVGIVNLAREGEGHLDTDLRSIRSAIQGGETAEQIKASSP